MILVFIFLFVSGVLGTPTPAPTAFEYGSLDDCLLIDIPALGINCTGTDSLKKGYFQFTDASVRTAQDTDNNAPFVPGVPSAQDVHVSCSDGFGFEDAGLTDGYGEKGAPIEGTDPQIGYYAIAKCDKNGALQKCCTAGTLITAPTVSPTPPPTVSPVVSSCPAFNASCTPTCSCIADANFPCSQPQCMNCVEAANGATVDLDVTPCTIVADGTSVAMDPSTSSTPKCVIVFGTVTTDIDTGNGNDVVAVADTGNIVNIRTREGDDKVFVGGAKVNSNRVELGMGADLLDMCDTKFDGSAAGLTKGGSEDDCISIEGMILQGGSEDQINAEGDTIGDVCYFDATIQDGSGCETCYAQTNTCSCVLDCGNPQFATCTNAPTFSPSVSPSVSPTVSPTAAPTKSPTVSPTVSPTASPTFGPQDLCGNGCLEGTEVFTDVGGNQCITYTFNTSDAACAVSHFALSIPPCVNQSEIMVANCTSGFGFEDPICAPYDGVPDPIIKIDLDQTCGNFVTVLMPGAEPLGTANIGLKGGVSCSSCASTVYQCAPTASPSTSPTVSPTASPSASPSTSPTSSPTASPSVSPTKAPSLSPSASPSLAPSPAPTMMGGLCDGVDVNLYGINCTGSPDLRTGYFEFLDTTVRTAQDTDNEAPFVPGVPSGVDVHLSCSDEFGFGNPNPTGFGEKGAPVQGTDVPLVFYAIAKCDKDGILKKCCMNGAPLTPAPSESPTTSPSASPTKSPTTTPSASPTGSPTTSPSASPTESPTTSPSVSPTGSPTTSPSGSPTESPTTTPSASPTKSPTTSPSASPTGSPTTSPSVSPTGSPTTSPSVSPTGSPTTTPSASPTKSPTTNPSASPTESPTTSPSVSPSASPTTSPSVSPTASPTTPHPTPNPTDPPSTSPSMSPSSSPSLSPSSSPTVSPSSSPTLSPSSSPSLSPTSSPSASPTTSTPTVSPSESPTASPTTSPTPLPSPSPTHAPTHAPSPPMPCTNTSQCPYDHLFCMCDGFCHECNGTVIASGLLLSFPEPCCLPGPCHTSEDCDEGYLCLSYACVKLCTNHTECAFDEYCSLDPHGAGVCEPCQYGQPCCPTDPPTFSPSESPSSSPTSSPTTSPSSAPTGSPTTSPTSSPSPGPTPSPTESPTSSPSISPTGGPTESPSPRPTGSPTTSPTTSPSTSPTSSPTTSPSGSPTTSPTSSPSVGPTGGPTTSPSTSPTGSPTTSPTPRPTSSPTSSPSISPSGRPTGSPTISPSGSPSTSPTTSPTPRPTGSPTKSPTTSNPSISPSASPTTSPSPSPTDSPTVSPSRPPTPRPTGSPTESPTTSPSVSPTTSPTGVPTEEPTPSPSSSPTASPSNPPTVSPTNSPTLSPIPTTPCTNHSDCLHDHLFCLCDGFCGECNGTVITSSILPQFPEPCCLPGPCQHTDDCALGYTCLEYACFRLCNFASDCSDGEFCATDHGHDGGVCEPCVYGEPCCPTLSPTEEPTLSPTESPSESPTPEPSPSPTPGPSESPTTSPTAPTASPTPAPTVPTPQPTATMCDDDDDCDDEDKCTIDYCDLKTRCCVFEHDHCNDNNHCTVDFCVAGHGCAHPPVNCSVADPCLAGKCWPKTGCMTTPIEGCCKADADCEDDSPCTRDRCENHKCIRTQLCGSDDQETSPAPPAAEDDTGSIVIATLIISGVVVVLCIVCCSWISLGSRRRKEEQTKFKRKKN